MPNVELQLYSKSTPKIAFNQKQKHVFQKSYFLIQHQCYFNKLNTKQKIDGLLSAHRVIKTGKKLRSHISLNLRNEILVTKSNHFTSMSCAPKTFRVRNTFRAGPRN